ncbi:uncharacterized protein apof [Anguilla rostrata]|uniref:uncharacterized protein apof n=1 Tax=Anguilla rostrata TaxID=7938 RepID=UPI0030CBF8E7
MNPNLNWLILVRLLLTNPTFSIAQSPSGPDDGLHRGLAVEEEEEGKQERKSFVSGSPLEYGPPLGAGERVLGLGEGSLEEEDRERAALRLVTIVTAMLRDKVQAAPPRGNASCEELLASASLGGTSLALFPRELLGLSLVPVLGVSGCTQEAKTLTLQLFEGLGMGDTEELLLEINDLIGWSAHPHATATLPPPTRKAQEERHLQAIMFNIQQLGGTGESPERGSVEGGDERRGRCQGWTRVNGTFLLGDTAGEEGGIGEAVRTCENLGAQCAGVSGGSGPGRYRAVLRRGGRIVPTAPGSESWIRECREPAPGRVRRHAPGTCVDKREERVYSVVEWIPGVSTLYSLGTAVYYASVNCTETAKERAILSAVDLGTDALMAVTGGAAGVAGYALGAGVKTGVKAGIKYLLQSMKHEEDLIVNRSSWDTSITVQ